MTARPVDATHPTPPLRVLPEVLAALCRALRLDLTDRLAEVHPVARTVPGQPVPRAA